ncbi:hypothetical protein [Lelliottia jeotgali]
MIEDSEKLLGRLRERRHGTGSYATFAMDSLGLESLQEAIGRQSRGEDYEKRAKGKPYTIYALGAMQQVDAAYTQISLKTAARVQEQLRSRLSAIGYALNFRHQGSVPLNVHIKGVSDIDLLTIEDSIFMYDPSGVAGRQNMYSPASRSPVDLLSALRRDSEKALREAFYAATVETSGAKAIKVYGASLQRAVDVVPSLWWNGTQYQSSGEAHDRGVAIYNKEEHSTIKNLPFLHIKMITDACNSTFGGLRKSIRLLKNVKADANEDHESIKLSSYDIAGLMYHADRSILRAGLVTELAILAETQRHLEYLVSNESHAESLRTPDNTRCIIDSPRKFSDLRDLSHEITRLMDKVSREQPEALHLIGTPAKRDALSRIRV